MKIIPFAAILLIIQINLISKKGIVAQQPCPGGCNCPCNVDSDCYVRCTRCSDQAVCVLGAACGGSCNEDSDCDKASKCGICYSRTCVSSLPCGAPCISPGQCDANNGCAQCIAGHCGVACGAPCKTSIQCQDPACGACKNGTCSQKDCGGACTGPADCVGTCHQCAPNGTCVASLICGQACETSLQCNSAGNCTECIPTDKAGNKHCYAGCGYPCADGECGYPDCNVCAYNTCASHGKSKRNKH